MQMHATRIGGRAHVAGAVEADDGVREEGINSFGREEGGIGISFSGWRHRRAATLLAAPIQVTKHASIMRLP